MADHRADTAGAVYATPAASGLALGLLPVGLLLLFVAVGGVENTQDLTAATMRALILQLAALGVAVAIPRYVADDLDLSVGPVALLGMIWAVSQASGQVGAFLALLPLVGAAGLAIGLLNGLLTVGSRLPAAAVTLATGALVAAALSRVDVHLAVPTPMRLTLDGAALGLFVAAAAAAALLGWSSRRASRIGRAAALAVSSWLAAWAGAMIGAQGVRDAGFLSQGAFVSALPLIALVVGGQHVLPCGAARLAAAAGGALLAATVAVALTQPSDNLAPGLLPAAVLAVVVGFVWRLLAHRAVARRPLADA